MPVIETPVVGLESDDGRLRRVRLGEGQTLRRDALLPAATGSGATAAVAINARLCFEDADRAVARHATAARSR